MSERQHYLTPEGAQRLREELEFLKTTKRNELAKRLREAIQMGDLSENADYIAAKEEQGFLEGRIQEIEALLRQATIIDGNHTKDYVDLGARVTIREGSYPAETYHIVGPAEANPRKGKISHESPIGQALMGHRVGDEVTVNTPGGEIVFKIEDVAY